MLNMAGTGEPDVGRRGRCPRCEVCGVAVRVLGVGMSGVWCKECWGREMPFVGLLAESDFKGALRDFREGLGSRAGDFQDLRLDPFDNNIRRAIGHIGTALEGCTYVGGDEVSNCLKKVAKKEGCSLSLLCHNIRSAKGPGLELLETEIRRWGVQWDVVGSSETWLDKESEKRLAVQGYNTACASRKNKPGGESLF